jgi:hypothetical protein
MEFAYSVVRDAYATIAGFILQVDLIALRWLNLDDLETLELECGEEIDTVGKDMDGWVGWLSANVISQSLREAILSNNSSSACYQRGSSLIPPMETMAAGMIYMTGSAIKAKVQDALITQTWLREPAGASPIFALHP